MYHFGLPKIPPVSSFPFILFISTIEILYIYPYTTSLRNIDTSIVTALFSLGKFFVPLFAFLIVGEKLSSYAYIGFFIILTSSILLSFNKHEGKFKLNISFFYMLGCSMILSLSSVVEKYTLSGITDWITLFFWTQICASCIVLLLLIIPKYKKDVLSNFKNLKPNVKNLLLQSFLAVGGVMGMIYAINIAPITFIKGISSLQPLMVIFTSYLIHKFKPSFIYESLGKLDLYKKIVCFILTAIGVYMMIL